MNIVDYRMNNPTDAFFNTVGGLQQIQSNQMNINQRQQEQQAKWQTLDRSASLKKQAQQLIQSGASAQQVAEFSAKSPEMGKMVRENLGLIDQEKESAFLDATRSILADPSRTEEILQHGYDMVPNSGDEQISQAAIRKYKENPQEFIQGIEKTYAMLDSQGFSAYKKASEQPSSTPEYSNIQFDKSGKPFGLNKQTGAYEEVGGGFQRAKPTAQTVVNVGKAEGEQQKTIAKAEGDLYNEIQKSGFQSRKSDATLNRLEKLSDKAFDGATAGAYKGAAKLAESIGIDVEGLTETELFTALSNDLVLGQTALLTGVLTDKDMAFLEQTVPQLSQTKEGRKQLIGIMKDVNEANREKAQLAKDFRKLNDGYFDSAAFDELMANRKPKDRFAPEEQQQIGAPSVGTVNQGYEFLGGNPADKSSWRKI